MKRKRKTEKGKIAALTKWLKLEEMRTVVNTVDSILRWFGSLLTRDRKYHKCIGCIMRRQK